MTTFTYTHSLDTDATAEAVWALYEDVSTWPSWDAEAEQITRDGPFAAGTTGTMKFRGQEPLAYVLASVAPLSEFTDEVRVGPMLVRVSHLLESLDDGRLRLTYAAAVDGPEPDAGNLGRAITADFPATMEALVSLARVPSA